MVPKWSQARMAAAVLHDLITAPEVGLLVGHSGRDSAEACSPVNAPGRLVSTDLGDAALAPAVTARSMKLSGSSMNTSTRTVHEPRVAGWSGGAESIGGGCADAS